MLLSLALAPLLIVPLTDMDWGLEDLIASTALIVGAGFVYEVALQIWRGSRQRAAAAGVTGAAVLLIWAELSVGLFH